MQLAARMLQTTREAVIQVASEVGYDSEAAFNRAFKREFGIPRDSLGTNSEDRAPDRGWLEGTGERASPRARREGNLKSKKYVALTIIWLVPVYQ
ncbi:helix-turn-helix domain-containing protein [Bradyrhizobium sp. RDT10]